MMGEFHIFCSFMAPIGKRFGDASLADVLVESEIVGSRSMAAAVLEVRHNNSGLCTHEVLVDKNL